MTNAKPRKTALVTGASSGIGRAITMRLLQDGLTVVVAARDIERLRDLEAYGAQAVAFDVTDEAAVCQAVEDVNATYGGIDVLVNNAGFTLFGAVEDVLSESARYQFDVNVFGVGNVTRAVLRRMRERKRGRIVNISSMCGTTRLPLGAWYHATKHALEGWSDCLRLEVAPFGIHVVIIEPGIIRTGTSGRLVQGLLINSAAGAYADIARSMARMLASADAHGGGSSPDVIANLVSHAIRAERPRTRYVAGKHAKSLMWLRRNLSDRLFDRIVMRFVESWKDV